MAPVMRRMLEWLGLTDSVDEFDPDYQERSPQYYDPEPTPAPAPPRNSNVQVYAEPPERRSPSTGRFSNPELRYGDPRIAERRASEPETRESRHVMVGEAPERPGSGEPLRGFNASASVKPIPSSPKPSVHILYPKRFRDATEVADLMRDGQPVILNLQNAERDLPRRMIDFCSGVTYALDGKMERVAESVFLLTPSNVVVSQEERANLSERGVF